MGNENLRLARQVKNDEFYTRYEDIEKELIRYKDQFKVRLFIVTATHLKVTLSNSLITYRLNGKSRKCCTHLLKRA